MKVTMFKNIIPATCRIILLIIFIFNSTCINAQQSKIGSLKNLIANTKKDTAKIDLYEKLGQAYRDEKKLDSCIWSYQRALKINEDNNFSLQKQCWDIATIDYLLYITGNYMESLKYATRNVELCNNLNDTFQMGFCHATFGHDYKALGEYRLSLNHYFKARQIFKLYLQVRNVAENDPYIIQCIGDVYLKMNQLDSALIYTQQSLVQKGLDQGNELYSIRILGDIYRAKGDDQRALNYYREYIPGFIKYNTPDFIEYKQNSRDLGFVFNSIAKIFQKRNQNDSAVFYAKKALHNAEEYHDEENIYTASKMLSDLYQEKNISLATVQSNVNDSNNKINRNKIDSFKRAFLLAKADTAKVIMIRNIAQEYENAAKLDSAIIYAQKELEFIQKNNLSIKREIWALAYLDHLTTNTGNFSISLQYATQALHLSEQIHDNLQITYANSGIAAAYAAMGNLRRTLYYYFKAKKAEETYEQGQWAIQNIAETYLKMHMPDSALYYNKIAYHIADTGNDQRHAKDFLISKRQVLSATDLKHNQYMKDFAIRVYGDIYAEKGEDELALKYYRQFIADFYKYNLNNREIDRVYLGIAKLYQKKNQVDSSIFYAEKALTAAKIYNDQEHIFNASELLYNLHDSLHNESQAFKYFKIAAAAKDSMASIEKVRQIQNLGYQEQVREKEKEEADVKERARNTLIITIAAILVSIISFLIWNRLRQLRTKHKMILEQKEAEKLRAIDKMKEKFFSNITHELRTPLSLIMSPAGFYLEHPDELNDTGKFLKSIYKNSGYLLNLINQLLDISKLDAGKMNIALSKGNFGNYIDDLVKTFKDEAIKKQIALHFDNDLAGAYLFDEEHWKKITNNLLGNALKFTPSNGDIFVSVNKISGTNESATIQVIVKDTGIGIDEDQVPFITDRFYQADNKLSRKYEGAGIGLSLVNELVKLMDGKLEIKSEKGKGSVFTITATLLSAKGKEGYPEIIPVVKTSQLSDINTTLRDIPIDRGKNVPLILVTEDNKELRDFLKDSIEPLYKVITASDGGEGLEMALTQIPDIIISDVMMPVMDGFEFCDKIKSSHATSHIPFIILSAKTNYESRIEGLQKGADDYLTKPFSVDELRTKIKNILQRQKKLQEYNLQQLLSENPLAAFTEVQNEFLQGIYKNIEDNLDDAQLTVEFLATKMALSEGTLNRKLIANIGLSANELIKQYHLKRAEMQKQMFELEAKTLRAQMNPHFIFNCLNSIKSLIQQNENKKSVTYLTIFSKLIRTLFNNADKKAISLFDEIETCKLYLQLEKMRFDEKFSYAVNVEDNIDLKSIQVPALIIQPFIENAIWHGIVPRNTGGCISLNVLQKNDMIEVAVEDDGIGRESSQQNKSASGLAHQSKGVNLTQSRIELNNLLQQRQAKLEIIDKKDENGTATGTTVIIKIKEEQL